MLVLMDFAKEAFYAALKESILTTTDVNGAMPTKVILPTGSECL